MKVEQLIKGILKWFKEDVVDLRVKNEENSRKWAYESLGYTAPLNVKAYQDFFERDDQNKKYRERYETTDIPARLPYAWFQTEINTIYSYHKCFAMRNNTRLQYYRHDLSQKGARVLSTVNQALGKFQQKRNSSEKP